MPEPSSIQLPGRVGLFSVVLDGEVLLIGGHSGQTPVRTVLGFRPVESAEGSGQWRQLPSILARRCYGAAAVLDGLVYVVGGSADGRTLNTMEVFNPRDRSWDQWFTKPVMQIKRTLLAAAAAEGKLYVLGGFDGTRDLPIMEAYDPRTKAWRWNEPLLENRSYLAVAACQDGFYALGGQDRSTPGAPRAYATAHFFKSYSGRWSEEPPMQTGRIGPAAAVWVNNWDEEFVFVLGGSDGDNVLNSVERLNRRKGVWEKLPDMYFARLGHVAEVVGNRLYVFGGTDGKRTLDTYESLDLVKGVWSPPMKMELLGAQ